MVGRGLGGIRSWWCWGGAGHEVMVGAGWGGEEEGGNGKKQTGVWE